MSSTLRIIVTGLLAEYPLGGMTWHYLQYVLGLARLGHDVYYIEDSGGWPYDPRAGGLGYSCDYNVQYLTSLMARFGLQDRWAYRLKMEHNSRWFGMSDARRREVIASADVLLNVSGTVDRPEAYRTVSRLAYIDTDPVFTQFRLAREDSEFFKRVNAHDVHFTFGERVSESTPPTGHEWVATRQPVVISEWQHDIDPRPVYTTVMNWTSYVSETFQGRSYGQKDVEFMRFLDLPQRMPDIEFEIAGGPGYGETSPRELITSNGWRLVDPMVVCPDLDSYRRYIQSSKAEWSVAKNAYVQGWSGWFSERSACYLAAGRPVIVQDTGFSDVLPVGEGLLTFSTLDEARDAICEVESHYSRHAEAARGIAEECFASDIVLGRLLERVIG